MIIIIDFEKAFDPISWEFIEKSLQIFNFGNEVQKWVKCLQKGSFFKVIQAGHVSAKIFLSRGCRQEDPISPYLFVIAAEILAESIRVNKNIKGITLFGKEFKISQYADDTSLYIQPEEESLKECMKCLSDFEYVSGLKINIKKTKIVKIGDGETAG